MEGNHNYEEKGSSPVVRQARTHGTYNCRMNERMNLQSTDSTNQSIRDAMMQLNFLIRTAQEDGTQNTLHELA